MDQEEMEQSGTCREARWKAWEVREGSHTGRQAEGSHTEGSRTQSFLF